jgi:hypothetical protein
MRGGLALARLRSLEAGLFLLAQPAREIAHAGLPVPDGGLEHGEIFVSRFARMCGRGCPAGLRPGACRANGYEQNRYCQLSHGRPLIVCVRYRGRTLGCAQHPAAKCPCQDSSLDVSAIAAMQIFKAIGIGLLSVWVVVILEFLPRSPPRFVPNAVRDTAMAYAARSMRC